MNKRNLYVGLGMGILMGSAAAMVMHPKKSTMKSAMGRALKTLSEVADSVSDAMGW